MRARATISSDISVAMTEPRGISWAKEVAMVPEPVPTSRRVKDGVDSAREASRGRRWGALFWAVRHSWWVMWEGLYPGRYSSVVEAMIGSAYVAVTIVLSVENSIYVIESLPNLGA